jgi:hypothetical protein
MNKMVARCWHALGELPRQMQGGAKGREAGNSAKEQPGDDGMAFCRFQ